MERTFDVETTMKLMVSAMAAVLVTRTEPKQSYKAQIEYARRKWATDPEFRAKRNALTKAWYNKKIETDPEFAARMRDKAHQAYLRRKERQVNNASRGDADEPF
jgi:hypothetical protein